MRVHNNERIYRNIMYTKIYVGDNIYNHHKSSQIIHLLKNIFIFET